MAQRIGRSLERSGLITHDIENAHLAFDPGEEAPIHGLLGASITCRIAIGPREGQKVFTLQTLPAEPEGPRREVAESSGFSLHAGIAAKGSQRDKLEHLARYVSRPPVATEQLSLTERRHVRCALKTPYRDGTTHVIFEPEDFIARLAALVPKPRAHLTRYHAVFAPASPDRARVVPRTRAAASECGEASATGRQRALVSGSGGEPAGRSLASHEHSACHLQRDAREERHVLQPSLPPRCPGCDPGTGFRPVRARAHP